MRMAWLFVPAVVVALVSPVLADDALQRATLAGLTGVRIFVGNIDSDAEKAGLNQSTLQTDVEVRLRHAGIRVLTEDKWFVSPGMPSLYLRVDMIEDRDDGLYAYHIRLELAQQVRLARDPEIRTFDRVWGARESIGIAGADNLSTSIRERVRDKVDEFINAYLAANPKR